MNKISPYTRRVYYYETDTTGIMHHANFIRIFEESRVAFMQQAGTPFEKVEALGILMPVLSVDSRYKSPLRFDETFAVYPKVVKFNGTTIEMYYKVINRNTGSICAEGSSSHCFTDEQLKPIRLKHKFPDVYQLFADYYNVEITD